MVALMNLPARLKGCRRARFEADADLDAVFGSGTAAAVLGAVAHPSGGRMLRTRLLRRLLLAVRRDLDDGISLPLQSSGKGAAAVQAVLDTLPPVPAGQDRHREGTQQQQQQQQQQEPQEPPSPVADAEARLAAFKTQLLQAARKQSPDIPGVRLAVSRAQQLLQAAGVLGDEAPARWNAALGLLQRLSSSSSSSGQGGGGSSGGGQSRRGTAAGRSPSCHHQALLVLFLLATGRLRAELEVDLMRLRPRNVGTPLFGRPELLVGEIKSDLSELGPARRQLEIALAVLELACRFSPYYGGGGVLRGLLAPYSRWRPPSLDARAVVCGVLDGKALAARQGLLGDLQVQLVADLDLDPDRVDRVLGPVAAVAAAARGEAGQAAAAAAAAAGGGPELAAGGPPADSGVVKAHAQGEVEAQSEDEAAAVMMHVPLEVFWFDGSGT
ncbi:hypothetical protein CHLRE_12g548700v5 [Chlamydomonas reinhardtii]|uniref:Uncharacterized protein n=1 Tax=Chlamydomonas reinhardtii TaxID=3055 RepID=A0A2K3D6B6_CHLRE|nr:uncharacterized protein CHLRE_12g548700v5 [Chlamydomonas reinhardtii]XP_042919043.1 uncharacterized protein CHLRE_12g548700v5 [Chlamydomonas reinhardtii]XP_042919044.1 uncharacterized protein CHLRE_12g548700v5 [Chlamydomonas reinhardtii]PNW76074.1 hypothetical protein CHLRE_12g548700v5 [Chlamydomonas reinhardtii]PNW76075.1 hypothetical protein CHLRE_12g548700v5 [Chlamydomonas reinhardtii]PNW76076.1 hypothetical protein CHLRE_12g548700v5 [Chlamydomonas reinhardtii]